jgi:metal-dependent amidase/aminoacylase/carboxypeptidase family protein
VIPEKVELAGTFRTMNEEWRKIAHQEINKTALRVAQKWNATINVNIVNGYPFLVNDKETTESAKNAAELYLGKEQVTELPMRMTAEDFAYISQEVKSCFFRLGTGNKSKKITSGVHTPTFDIDENSLEIGSGLVAWMILSK